MEVNTNVCVWLTEMGLSNKLIVHWEQAAKFIRTNVYVLLELLCWSRHVCG